MKVIGIVSATLLEAEVLLGRLATTRRGEIHHKVFYELTAGSRDAVVLCIAGVGKVNAAHATALLIEHFAPGLIVTAGVAGAFPSAGLGIGDVVLADREVYGDEGLLTVGGFLAIEELGWPLFEHDGRPAGHGFALSIPESLRSWRNRGTSVTVSCCTGTLERARYLEGRFGALCENMEGAAVAHVAGACGVPVTGLRGISNVIGDRGPGPLPGEDIRAAAGRVQELILEALL